MSAIDSKVLTLLVKITGVEELRENRGIDLFEGAILDSLGVVQLLAGLSEELQINIAPSEIERSLWSTPDKIIAFVESRAARTAVVRV